MKKSSFIFVAMAIVSCAPATGYVDTHKAPEDLQVASLYTHCKQVVSGGMTTHTVGFRYNSDPPDTYSFLQGTVNLSWSYGQEVPLGRAHSVNVWVSNHPVPAFLDVWYLYGTTPIYFLTRDDPCPGHD